MIGCACSCVCVCVCVCGVEGLCVGCMFWAEVVLWVMHIFMHLVCLCTVVVGLGRIQRQIGESMMDFMLN